MVMLFTQKETNTHMHILRFLPQLPTRFLFSKVNDSVAVCDKGHMSSSNIQISSYSILLIQ